MEYVSGRFVEKNQDTYFMFNKFFRKSCRIYVMLRNIVELDRPQMTIGRMRIVCSMTKAKGTQSEHVILIALPQQQWLQVRA
jgi:hypothetical protein